MLLKAKPIKTESRINSQDCCDYMLGLLGGDETLSLSHLTRHDVEWIRTKNRNMARRGLDGPHGPASRNQTPLSRRHLNNNAQCKLTFFDCTPAGTAWKCCCLEHGWSLWNRRRRQEIRACWAGTKWPVTGLACDRLQGRSSIKLHDEHISMEYISFVNWFVEGNAVQAPCNPDQRSNPDPLNAYWYIDRVCCSELSHPMGIFTPHPSATNQPMQNYAFMQQLFSFSFGMVSPSRPLSFFVVGAIDRFWCGPMMGVHAQVVYDPLQLSKCGSGSVKHIILSPSEYVISNLCIFMASGTNLDVLVCFLAA